MIEFTDNPIQALPVVLAVLLIYWLVRRIWQKRKYGGDFKEYWKKVRLNEVIRLFFFAWVIECVCCTLLPTGFIYRVWIHFFEEDMTFFRSTPQWNITPSLFSEINIIQHIQSEKIRQDALLTLVLSYIFNILMFMPLGFALPFIWKRANFIKVVLIGFISTLFIEFIQGFINRDSTIDDIICNTFGAIFGYLLYMAIKKCFPKIVTKASNTQLN